MNRDAFGRAMDQHRNRLRNQLGNLITSFSSAGLIVVWVVLGAIVGSWIGRHFTHASGLIVIGSTVLGFLAGLVTASALSPRMIQLALRAQLVSQDSLGQLIRDLEQRTAGQLRFHLFSVNQDLVHGFGHNVVVTGLPWGRGMFTPAIFASESVLRGCSEDELYAIFAHEIAHVRQRHLIRRIGEGLAVGALGSLFTSLMIVGLQMMGFKGLAIAVTTASALIPVLLIWLNLQRLLQTQEKEADWIAIRDFQASPLDLLNALKKLTLWNQAGTHPLVHERMLILQGLWLSEAAWTARAGIPENPDKMAA